MRTARPCTPGYRGKRPIEEYLACEGMLDGRDEDIRCRTVSVVTTRKPHECFSFDCRGLHAVPAGTRAIYEHAIVDGKWGSFYTCLECADSWLDFLERGCREDEAEVEVVKP